MKFPFFGILLAALAVTPSLGSLFEHQPDIAVAIKVQLYIQAPLLSFQ
jgi:hypothetical protein